MLLAGLGHLAHGFKTCMDDHQEFYEKIKNMKGMCYMTPSIHLAMVIWHQTYKSKTFVVEKTFYLTVISNGSVLCLYFFHAYIHLRFKHTVWGIHIS